MTGAGCAGDGIGNDRAIAITLVNNGCNVICLDRDQSWAQKTVSLANGCSTAGKAVALAEDVTLDRDCEAAVHRTLEEFGRLDILVNNVGVSAAKGTAVEVDMADWTAGLELNVSSMVRMAKYAIPAMEWNGGEIRGSIVNMDSIAGLKGGTPHLLYPTSKEAVVNMTRAMAAHHAKSGIRLIVSVRVYCTLL